MIKKTTVVVLLTLILVMIHPGIAVSEENLEQDFRVVSRLYHNTVESGYLYLEFSYRTVNPVSGNSEPVPGKIWLHSDRFRMEADGNLFIKDSLAFYQVFNIERQIIIDSGSTAGHDLHPAGLLSQLELFFKPLSRTLLSDGCEQYALEPLGSDWLLEADLKIQDERIQELRLLDINSTRTVIQITAEQRGDRVADSLFQLSPRISGYETIDLRGASR